MFKKIDCIMIRVKDLESSARFYSEILGLKRAWFEPEQNMIGLKLLESDTEIVLHTEAKLEGKGPHYLVEDVVEAYETLRARGSSS